MTSPMISIVDYGVGNLHNLKNAFNCMAIPAQIVCDAKTLQQAERIVLPGVGAFAPARQRLFESGMEEVLCERIASGAKLLGVCIGMQLLFESSEENGVHQGLGLLHGTITRFTGVRKVPHMGWNQVQTTRNDPIFEGIPNGSHFYFVHSYYAQAQPQAVLGEADYGKKFAAVVATKQIWGVQFHPEKSQTPGLQLLKNFAQLC